MPTQVSNPEKAALTWDSKYPPNPVIEMDYGFKSFQNVYAAHFSLYPHFMSSKSLSTPFCSRQHLLLFSLDSAFASCSNLLYFENEFTRKN